MFLDFAEDRASRRQQITMEEWMKQTDQFLAFNEREILSGAGSMGHKAMETIVGREYLKFEENRKKLQAEISEDEFTREVEVLGKKKK